MDTQSDSVPPNYITQDVFDALNIFIITKPDLQDSVITIDSMGHKIVGYPVRINNEKYERNALMFNMCFVFDSDDDDALSYEPIVTKLAAYLSLLEKESEFLSNANKKKLLPDILADILINMNKNGYCSISINDSTTINLKSVLRSVMPSSVEDHSVPIFDSKQQICLIMSMWDLSTQQLLPHIDGFKHISRIAYDADVGVEMVKVCIQNLIYFGVIKLISIFQYSNSYVTTADIRLLYKSADKKREFIDYIMKPCSRLKIRNYSDFHLLMETVFKMLSDLKGGVTVRDICVRHQPYAKGIDERRLIQFAVLRNYIRRLHKYPILNSDDSIDDIVNSNTSSNPIQNIYGSKTSLKTLLKFCTGHYCYDLICCRTGMSYNALNSELENQRNISVLWK